MVAISRRLVPPGAGRGLSSTATAGHALVHRLFRHDMDRCHDFLLKIGTTNIKLQRFCNRTREEVQRLGLLYVELANYLSILER